MMLQELNRCSRIKANNKNYFLNLKRTSNGKKYLKITESIPDGNGSFSNKVIIIFEEDLNKFYYEIGQLLS